MCGNTHGLFFCNVNCKVTDWNVPDGRQIRKNCLLLWQKEGSDMTLGHRIQQKRKEKGLSQEKLGEQLNVSRQTVYKWENDQTIPELNNLIEMAELLDVRVGWLICEESGNEDSTNQILEQIVENTQLHSQQQQKKRKWKTMCAVIIAGCALIAMMIRISSLENRYDQLQNQLYQQNTIMHNQISSITSSVEQALDRYNALTLNSDVRVEGYDYENNTVLFSFSARPVTYVTGMKTIFHIDCDGEIMDVEGVEEDRNFSAEAEVSMLVKDIGITVEFENGEESEISQLAEYHEIILNTFPCLDFVWPLDSDLNEDKTGFESDECMIIAFDIQQDIPEVVSMEVYLSEDGKRIADYNLKEIHGEEEQPGNYVYHRPSDLKLDPDKKYAEHLVVTDEYGRVMEVIQDTEGVITEFR